MARYLVLANRTLGGARLAAHLDEVIAADAEASFVVVVPLRSPTLVGADPVSSGVTSFDWETLVAARDEAQNRLSTLLDWFDAAGVPAQGHVLESDPITAVERVLRHHPADAVVVSTLPVRVSRWLGVDVPRRLGRRLGLPLTTIVDDDRSTTLPEPGTAAHLAQV
jgi:nucleotide-binding universal stress UspA family protein